MKDLIWRWLSFWFIDDEVWEVSSKVPFGDLSDDELEEIISGSKRLRVVS